MRKQRELEILQKRKKEKERSEQDDLGGKKDRPKKGKETTL